MAETIIMPQLGETVAEGKILTWFKAVGDDIKIGDRLFEVETDKVTIDVESIVAGTLNEIKIAAGVSAKVGDVVAAADLPEAGEPGAHAQAAAMGVAQRCLVKTCFQPCQAWQFVGGANHQPPAQLTVFHAGGAQPSVSRVLADHRYVAGQPHFQLR